MSFYKTRPLRFKCTQCGQCCFGSKYAYVRASQKEVDNILHYLDLNEQYFKRHYLVKLYNHGIGIKINTAGACSLLSRQGECRAYPVRPVQCRTYPFWPEIINQASTWRAETKRCEGINCGDVVDYDYIEQQLKLGIEAEQETSD